MGLIKRKQMIVEAQSQRALILRAVTYWCFTILAVALLMLLWDLGRGTIGPLHGATAFEELRQRYGSLLTVSLFVLPVLMADAWIQSNRFAGPIYRLRTSLRDLVSGKPVGRVTFRKGDYWQGLAEDLNATIEYVEDLRARSPETAKFSDAQSALEPETVGVG